jgi:hypothetical protein
MLNLFVDVHGVLANFLKPFCDYHELLGIYENWPKGQYDIETVTGIPWMEFPLDDIAALPEMPDYIEIMPLIAQHNVAFISRVAHHQMATAVLFWLQQRIDPISFLFTTSLKAEALPLEVVQSSVLIDDCDAEVNAWLEKGGKAILLPRPWNSGQGDPIQVLSEYLIDLDFESDSDLLEYEP